MNFLHDAQKRSTPPTSSSTTLVLPFSFLLPSRFNSVPSGSLALYLVPRGEEGYKAVLWSVGEAVGRAWSAAVYAEPPCLPPAAAGLRVRPCSLGGYVSSVRLGAHDHGRAQLRRVKRRERGRKRERCKVGAEYKAW